MSRRLSVAECRTCPRAPYEALRELEAGLSGLQALCDYLSLKGADPEPESDLSAMGVQQLLEGPRQRIDRAHALIRSAVLGSCIP